MFETVYIGLGSNIDSPREQLERAFSEITALPQTELIARSACYRTPAWGITDQPDFINAVVKIKTMLAAPVLLDALLAIEQAHQRVRTLRNGPRSLDCDILLYGTHQINTQSLTIPHPGLTSRAFVLAPLTELEPDLILPEGQAIKDLLSHCDCTGIQKYHEETAL
jgi:2-amino-4-hydroxy-6-hydroxymethyldihydropteridine diphosphokinase